MRSVSMFDQLIHAVTAPFMFSLSLFSLPFYFKHFAQGPATTKPHTYTSGNNIDERLCGLQVAILVSTNQKKVAKSSSCFDDGELGICFGVGGCSSAEADSSVVAARATLRGAPRRISSLKGLSVAAHSFLTTRAKREH